MERTLSQFTLPRPAFLLQSKYPPELAQCLVLITLWYSLNKATPDLTLEKEVTAKFRKFGTVYPKVRRDQRGMPFAFCQFTVRQSPKY